MSIGAFLPIRGRAALTPPQAEAPPATGASPAHTSNPPSLPPQGRTESDSSFARRIWETLT